ncbi:plasma-membrane proton-efflux P-type ATPase [Methanolobus sp. ZRKC2]|uniref:plasma-membrane proton-efflux P-type ATPase n=1 Tax=Methanolobus sp. ZRKC2 TaxID=3125783 RepID=UPI0032463702
MADDAGDMSSKDQGKKEKFGSETSVDEVMDKLSSSPDGLTASEAQERIQKYGYNEIVEKKVSPLRRFLGYFWGPIPWMIEIAIILSAIIQSWDDLIIIFVLLLINAVVGFWQENKADNAIELLKKRMALNARVKRDDKWTESPARELVPGDIVRLRLGDIVPADVKLIKGDYLQIDESALTGESLPVEKHVSDVAYSGSIIQKGEMNALVVSTGMDTYFGKTTRLVAEAKTVSHFQKAVMKIGDYLIVLAVFAIVLIFMVALYRQESMLTTLQFALVLTVAAIPAALPAVLSVSMAVGATDLSKKEAIVSKPVAIEEMAGMDVLCSDKTGTITQNKLTLADVVSFGDFSDTDVYLGGLLASRKEDHDPIDTAIISGVKGMEDVGGRSSKYKVLEFKPFDPVIKRAQVTVEDSNGKHFQFAKGAPQVILEMSSNKDAISDELNTVVEKFASEGHRALGVAGTDENGTWRMLGILALYDPPYDDSAETIKKAQSLGVKIKMVTGDHIAIAKEIAGQVNLGKHIIAASKILHMSDNKAMSIVENADGFAQVFPEHKYHIVELLQNNDHIVGMTGDGVNDAPALKKANAGIAVAGATDAAKSAADIVFTKPGLSVIVDAVRESRIIFQRMKSYSVYRVSETVNIVFFIALSIVVFNLYPITAFMIVLLALLNDGPIMAIAYDNVKPSPFPDKWNMRSIITMATFLGFISVFFSFLILYLGETVLSLSQGEIQSFIFLKLAVAGHLTIFLARTRGPFWSIKPGGLLLWSAVATKLFATLIVVYGLYITPIGWELAIFVWVYSLVAFVITDFLKVRFYKVLDHKGLIFHR